MRISILIVDDHPAVGIGTKDMILKKLDANIHVVHCENHALEIVKRQRFDIVLCDWQLPKNNGIELSKQLLHIQPEMKIILYSGFELEDYFNEMIEAGICGLLDKTSTSHDLVVTIEMVLEGKAVIPLSLMKRLRTIDVKHTQEYMERNNFVITERERELLQAISLGYSNRELAEKFHISQRGMEYQLKKLFDKMQVRSRAKAITMAIALGYISTANGNNGVLK